MADVKGRKVAVLATDGVEQVELTEPVKALKQAGAEVMVVSPKSGTIQGFNHLDEGDKLPVDAELSKVKPEQFDALMLPGGVANPDQLRMMEKAVAFVKHFVDTGKPIAAICHAPWTLIDLCSSLPCSRQAWWPRRSPAPTPATTGTATATGMGMVIGAAATVAGTAIRTTTAAMRRLPLSWAGLPAWGLVPR
jgi:deglycase